jgi:hypothetical protein
MISSEGRLSPSGVWVADDFRSNLIIDRYDPVFADMRASKLKHLRSANSEDAVTWNVFRSLRQIAPEAWLPELWQRAFPAGGVPPDTNVTVKLWESVPPPLGLLADGDEGLSEVDVVLESPTWVWFLEAKYQSDISVGTTTRPDRDQVLRNIDIGSYFAGVRQFFFSLLIASESRSPIGVQRIQEYESLEIPRRKLESHRPDGLKNVGRIGILTWSQLAEVLSHASDTARRGDEQAYARNAVTWLQERVLTGNLYRRDAR